MQALSRARVTPERLAADAMPSRRHPAIEAEASDLMTCPSPGTVQYVICCRVYL